MIKVTSAIAIVVLLGGPAEALASQLDTTVGNNSEAIAANEWYTIDTDSSACIYSEDNSPAKIIIDQKEAHLPYSTTDVTDPVTGEVVQTTIETRFMQVVMRYTFYRGLARCERASAVIKAERVRAKADEERAKAEIIAKYGNPPVPSAPQAAPPDLGQIPKQPTGGGLTLDQRAAIANHARDCWTDDPGMLDLDKMQVLLTVTTDADGVAREAVVAPLDRDRLAADPRLRVFAERAVRAVLSPACANLPLPPSMLGKVNVLTFQFSP